VWIDYEMNRDAEACSTLLNACSTYAAGGLSCPACGLLRD
jgi:hypothetical protein